MSLLRLLTTGKSLVDVRNTENRYRLPRQRLLPHFGPTRNPFRDGAHPSSGAATAASKGGAGFSSLLGRPEAAAPEDGRTPLARASYTRAIRSVAREAWRWIIARLSGWKVRLDKLAARLPQKAERPAIPRFTKPPAQGELSLDRVKVVRNDLSEADLELVPAKPKAAPALMEAEPAGAVASAWGQVTTRIFHAGKR